MAGKSFGFCGPAYADRGIVADCQRLVNLYLEKVESGNSASPGNPYILLRAPGKQIFATCTDSPVCCVVPSNASFYDPTVNLFFVVSGNTLFAVTAVFTAGAWVGSVQSIGSMGTNQTIDGTGGQTFPAQIIVIQPKLLFVVMNGTATVAAFGAPITGSALNAGGSGYAIGDTGTITGGLIPAQYVITAVGGTGDVTGYTLTFAGTGYSVTTGASTVPGGTQPGNGDSAFTIDISSVGADAWSTQVQEIPDGQAGTFIRTATWMDGYTIISMAPNAADPLRRQFFISALNDPTSWSPLDFDTKEANSDPVMAVFAAYEILIVFGSQTIELWQDSGDVLSAFQRLPGGGVIENGLASPWAVSKMDGTVVWLGSDARGQYVAWQLRGTTPVRISNHAIENTWSNYNVAGASAYSYMENGHFFWVLHFPIPDKTWAYDSTLGPAIGWHEREFWDGSAAHADRGRYHGFFPEIGHVVGNPNTGELYLQSMTWLTDNCDGMRLIRVAPHVATGLNWNYFDEYRLHALTGLVPASGAGSNPQCNLEISNDGGRTYGSLQQRSMGTTGQFNKLIQWLRQGRARNRVVRWTMNEPVDVVIVDMYSDASPGVG